MTQAKPFTALELATHVHGKIVGNGSRLITGIASLESAGEGDVAYVEDEKFFEMAGVSKASCLIVPVGAHVKSVCRIEAQQPKLAFAFIAALLHPATKRDPAVHSTAVIAKSAMVDGKAYIAPYVVIGEHSIIGAYTRVEAGVVIGANVTVGSDCVLHPNVVLYDDVSIGDRVILHAGVCVGADGFGYVRNDMGYHKFPQVGTVVIEDDVELGAHTCIDRAALGRTRIGRGTKLDNMVHVGHNCDIGEHVVIAAQTGISGSVIIEDEAVIGGQVGFGDHTRVQKGAIIGSKAGILPGKIVRPGVWWGIPIQPLADYKRMNAHLGRLPQMREELKELREQVKKLQDQVPSSLKGE